MSETEKYLHLTTPYCVGNGVDIGSQGCPVVPWAIQVELPDADYKRYTSGSGQEPVGSWRGDGRVLPFKDATLDFVYSSHLLEDFLDWRPVLREWIRVLKPGGHLIILVPENNLWNDAVVRGQPPNCAHQHCGTVGELTHLVPEIEPRMQVLRDDLTACFAGDYSLLMVARKT